MCTVYLETCKYFEKYEYYKFNKSIKLLGKFFIIYLIFL